MSKYDPLYKYLSANTLDTFQLSYKEIEQILSFNLPSSAYNYRAWWSGSKRDHPHCKSWQDAGYMVVPNLSNQTVVFHKNDEIGLHSSKNIPTTSKIKLEGKSITGKSAKIPQYPKTQTVTSKINFEEKLLNTEKRTLALNGYTFYETHFSIEQTDIQNTFLMYTKYSVEEMLAKEKFKSLKHDVYNRYPDMINLKISEFLKCLMDRGDDFYLKFLNKHGAEKFCVFKLTDKSIFHLKGLYVYMLDGNLKYIGRCRDSFKKRFNVNYGKIHAKNCFKDGQSTNTHMNALMNKHHDGITIYLLPLYNDNEIISLEAALIQQFKPDWNIQRY